MLERLKDQYDRTIKSSNSLIIVRSHHDQIRTILGLEHSIEQMF